MHLPHITIQEKQRCKHLKWHRNSACPLSFMPTEICVLSMKWEYQKNWWT